MELSDYRKEIDDIDSELIRLWEKRMDVSSKVAQYKLKNNMAIFNGAREAEVLKKNIEKLNNKSYELYAKKFFNNIMEISRSLQQNYMSSEAKVSEEITSKVISGKIGFQGVEGSFSEEALIRYFGDSENVSHYENFSDVFQAIKDNEIDYGVLPVENSSTGAITEVYDLMNKYGFYIVGEQCVKIQQHLVGVKGTSLGSIKEIYSHQQGFQQSSDFLKNNKEWILIPYFNTAISAKLVADLRDNSKAAISSKRAAEIYGLEVLKENINNESENLTRFLIIGRNLEVDSTCNKISVVFSLEDEVGTLYSLLRNFAENNINLKKIESRPIKNSPWKYLLYVDFNGNINEVEVKKSLELIKSNSGYFKLLGNYKNFN